MSVAAPISVRNLRIGLDLGGTKIQRTVLDPGGGERLRARVPTPASDYDGTVRALAELVAEADARLGATAPVGVAIPGTVSRATGLVRNANSTCLIGRPLDRDLAEAIGRPVRLANDANCFVLSEAVDGAARGYGVVFGVIVGTGCGGGLVVNGAVVTGAHGIAGEWGHNPLPWPAADETPGPACYCGLRGCVQTFLSGPGMARDHREGTGLDLKASSIAAAAEAGGADALATLARYQNRMARALASVINVLDPDIIVLGGGVSNIKQLYETVPHQWLAYVFSDQCETPLVAAAHGDASGVRGAARLWPVADENTLSNRNP